MDWEQRQPGDRKLGMHFSLIFRFFFFFPQKNTQREAQAAREAQQQLALMQSEVRRLEGELDTARRERDALQLEMSLVQVGRKRVPQFFFLVRSRAEPE